MTAHAAHPGGKPYAESPARNIHLVNALVADVAVSVVPEPVPVVVKMIPCEGLERRRAGPQVVVYAGGHGLFGSVSDGVAPFEAQAARHIDVADHARAHLVHGLPYCHA